MSIASAIETLRGRITAAYDAAEAKGATLPDTKNLANLADTIGSITGGGGGGFTVECNCNRSAEWNYHKVSELTKSNITGQSVILTGIDWLKANGAVTVDPASAAIEISINPMQYLIVANCTVTAYQGCLLPDTLITLSDGSKKQIKDITYDDELKVWDFDTGTYGTAPICWLTRSGLHNDHYYKLTFSDGTILKTTGQNSNHKVYNVDERFFKGVDKTEIGDRIFSENGIVTVTNKEYIEEDVEYYNLITTGKINCFANGILTSDRYGNLYPINENMTYNKEGRVLRPYSEFESVDISQYWYDTLRLAEVTGTIEETRSYINKLESQMLERPAPRTVNSKRKSTKPKKITKKY